MQKPPYGAVFLLLGRTATLSLFSFLSKKRVTEKNDPKEGTIQSVPSLAPPLRHLREGCSFLVRFWVFSVYCTPFIGALCACVYESAARKRVWVAEGYAMTTHSKARLAENLGGWGVGEGRLCEKPFPYLAFFSPFSWRNKKRAKSFSTKKHHPNGWCFVLTIPLLR